MGKRLLLVFFLPLLVCCKKHIQKPVNSNLVFNKVVILGNSIAFTPHNTAAGWYGDWGMAATAEGYDYVHILTGYFKVKNPNVSVNIKNIVPFELDPANYDFDVNLKDLKDSKPDLLILRIGENVHSDVDMQVFASRYTDLINYFKADNPNLIVLSAGSVWGTNVDAVMEQHPPYVLLSPMAKVSSNFSYGLWTDNSISLHPGNQGMQNIAKNLWAKISVLTDADRK